MRLRNVKNAKNIVDNSKYVIIIGESELEAGVVNVKAMATRKEIQVPLTEIYTNFSAVYDELTKEEDK